MRNLIHLLLILLSFSLQAQEKDSSKFMASKQWGAQSRFILNKGILIIPSVSYSKWENHKFLFGPTIKILPEQFPADYQIYGVLGSWFYYPPKQFHNRKSRFHLSTNFIHIWYRNFPGSKSFFEERGFLNVGDIQTPNLMNTILTIGPGTEVRLFKRLNFNAHWTMGIGSQYLSKVAEYNKPIYFAGLLDVSIGYDF